MFVYTLNVSDSNILEKMPLDVEQFFIQGVLYPCNLESDEEWARYVRLAKQLDDGEAEALAIAQERGWTIATEDKKGIRLAQESGVRVLSTYQLVQEWGKRNKIKKTEIRTVLENIQRFARFRPARSSPDHDAWMDYFR